VTPEIPSEVEQLLSFRDGFGSIGSNSQLCVCACAQAGWSNVDSFAKGDRILKLYKAECSGIFGTT
jgi:hypothetical protein